MITLCPGLYVTVQEVEGARAPQPRPLASGFSTGTAYRVLGLHSPSETSEAYFILSNDRDEVWFVSNRHFRTHSLQPDLTAFRLPLAPGDGADARVPTMFAVPAP